MWLVLDVGNSALKGALFDGDDLQQCFRIAQPLAAEKLSEALAAHVSGVAIERIGLVSVVPAATPQLADVCFALTGSRPEVIVHTMRLPFALAYETPHTLGTDRLAAAAAAWENPARRGRSVVAVDAGTATNYEVIDKAGVYRGGAIAPGPRLLRDALNKGTAQLPEVPLDAMPAPIGTSTVKALQAGVLLGFVDGVRGMLERMADALQERPFVVATGGWSALLAQHIPNIDAVDPHLVLRGVRTLLTLNPPPA